MEDWTAGYMADINYTFGYYGELNPLRIRLAFLSAGLQPPEIRTACELGFGQGVTVNIHAAASDVQWYGTDFNPSQAGFAKEVATAAGSGAVLHDDAFADFCKREELPEFDFICLHGIFSWISDANRQVIVDFMRRKLKVGGVVYISYNAMPGWASFAPMRHLFKQHQLNLAADGTNMVKRVEQALGFAGRLMESKPIFARANPKVPERLEKLKAHNKHYLAHEYFNAHWDPFYFADMLNWLTPAKLSFACSAHMLDHLDPLNLSADQQKLLGELDDPDFRQTVRDYMVNQMFRRDYWVKGARTLDRFEQADAFRKLRVVMVTPRGAAPKTATGALGESNLTESIYNPVFDLLADNQPRRLSEMEKLLEPSGVRFNQLQQVVSILNGLGCVQLAREDDAIEQARSTTDRLNLHVMQRAINSSEVGYLASPVTGGALGVSRFPQLFLLALRQGSTTPEQMAQFAHNHLLARGQRIQRDGKTLDSASDDLAELGRVVTGFCNDSLPLYRALKIAS